MWAFLDSGRLKCTVYTPFEFMPAFKFAKFFITLLKAKLPSTNPENTKALKAYKALVFGWTFPTAKKRAMSKATELPMEDLWKLLKRIPAGKVSTYKAVCEKLKLKNPRNVGWMLKHNKKAPTIPCHRIIQSSGLIGGYNGALSGKEVLRKIKLLKDEGVIFNPKGKIEDLSRVLHKL